MNERLGQLLSTVAYLQLGAYVVAGAFATTIPTRLGYTVVGLVATVPLGYLLVYRGGYDAVGISPLGLGDLIVLIVLIPFVVGAFWVTETTGVDGLTFWLVLVLAALIGLTVARRIRDALGVGPETPDRGNGTPVDDSEWDGGDGRSVEEGERENGDGTPVPAGESAAEDERADGSVEGSDAADRRSD